MEPTQKDDNERLIPLENLEPDFQIAYCLNLARARMIDHKPNDRSQKDRHWQITLTDLEKVIAYFDHWIVRGE